MVGHPFIKSIIILKHLLYYCLQTCIISVLAQGRSIFRKSGSEKESKQLIIHEMLIQVLSIQDLDFWKMKFTKYEKKRFQFQCSFFNKANRLFTVYITY